MLHAVEHLFHRHAAAAFVRRNDDLVDIEALRQSAQRLIAADQHRLIDHDRLVARRYKAEDVEGLAVAPAAQAGIDEVGVAAGAVDQHPLFQDRGGRQPRHHVAHRQHRADADDQRNRKHAPADVCARRYVIQHQQRDAAQRERQQHAQQQIEPAVADVSLVQAKREHRAGDANGHQHRPGSETGGEMIEGGRVGVKAQPRGCKHRQHHHAQLGQPEAADRKYLAA